MSEGPDELEAAHQARLAGDEVRALELYRAAAEHGDADAQNWTGYYYTNGIGAPKDEAGAVRWYRMAADLRDGRELMIERNCFKENIPTIQRRLLDILNL